ncbi:hypothetical protein TNCV_707321 [Trichonephila clavipes]|nr:hypothetical protein TNCV_707321 [Trichonephila clavipes]
MCEGMKEWTTVKAGVSLLMIVGKKMTSGEFIRFWMSEKKKGAGSNSSRVGSTSVSFQGVREESVVYFKRKDPPGDSVHPWTSK